MTKSLLIAITAPLALCAAAASAEGIAPKFVTPPKLGPFEVKGEVSVTGEYTDNVYSTENDRKGDFVTIVAPEVTLGTRSETYQLGLGASAEIGRFATESSEDYFDALLRAEGQYNFSEGFFLFGGADYAWEHEERNSPEEVSGVEPTEYREGSAFAGLSAEIGDFTTRLGVNFRTFDYDDTAAGVGDPINNDDRDRVQGEVGARVGYDLGDDRQVFVQGVYDRRAYDAEADDYGDDRDSAGFNAAIGYAGVFGPFRGEVLAGVLHQSYDDAAFDDVTVPDFGAELAWRPDPRTSFALEIDRRLEETTLEDASGYVATSAALRANRWLARDLRTTSYLGYSQNDYQGVGRIDYVTELGFGLRYFFLPNVFVDAGYTYSQRVSDAPGQDYDGHAAYLRLGGSLSPAYRENDNLATRSAGGFYAGVQVGDGLLKTSLEGPRGGGGPDGGSLVAEFGDFGPSGGGFAGYRAAFGDLVVGAEIDAGASAADWRHLGKRAFSVEAGNSFGLSGLMGVRIRNGVLVYGRGGVLGTEFESRYARGMHQSVRKEREIGFRVGFGAEVPLTPSLSARLEYGLVAYPDYDLVTNGMGETDNFANTTNLASFGLVYHFGAQPAVAPTPVEFGGFYAGGQIGHGGVASENSGQRPADEDPAFFLDVERAGMGATGGVVAGFGQTFGSFYLGAEVDAEISNAGWDIERDPTGRVYSVQKRGSVGASVRAGYVIGDSVLVYGRAGVANTWFDTDYSFGEANVQQKGSDVGLRFGGGVEFAVSDNLRMRLDYTRTDYGDYSVDYGTGTDSFKNSENLFRAGLVYGF